MDGPRRNTFMIRGSKLLPWRENHYNFHLSRDHHQIIKGTVYSEEGTPCAGASIMLTQIDEANQERLVLGYAVTDEAGQYLFSLEAKPQMKYELTVYAPLITNQKEDSS
ncbi:hypothetical protein LXJ15735_03240 [Lacrimispora xylanolytica]|uniref:Carboxypeptidase-like regulatory domain-containing protein n=1 Tax=Lacrimispora xylanolytica TaxID=29375 RepID=A0ABY7AF58_9FIRM|nr:MULTISPECIES: carboxypeptidase-like regulatory domain-containing protein [Clostridia]MBS5957633.1 carboxypeptidase regulatory-like domain-containing protein [Clostridiales bacterium]WAJ24141.1 carboxypeptidase-like regulatory domain-containing protein [Lacrimispora xylanolytica]